MHCLCVCKCVVCVRAASPLTGVARTVYEDGAENKCCFPPSAVITSYVCARVCDV